MEFTNDLSKFNDLPDDKIKDFFEYLSQNPFETNNDFENYEIWFKDNISKSEEPKTYYSIIRFIADSAITISSIDEMIKYFEADLLNITTCNDSKVIGAWSLIKKNLASLEPFILNIKKENIINRHQRLESFALTCDARPIFNIERSKINEFIYPIILSIKKSDSEEQLIIELTEDDLNTIIIEADAAKNKIEIIKKSIIKNDN